MNQTEIKKLLHHRTPYLFVENVREISSKMIQTEKVFTTEDFPIMGHFPGAPVVPGAIIQEFCTQSAGILITKYHSPVENYDSEVTKGFALGVLSRVNFAKFYQITKINTPLVAKIDLIDFENNLFKFKAKVFQNDKLTAKLSFNLSNISDEHLY